jgi:hypothetical protein
MDAVVNIFDIGKRQIMLQPVGGVIPGKFNLPGLDALNDAHVQAVIAHDFHVLSDLVGRNHVRLFVVEDSVTLPPGKLSLPHSRRNATKPGLDGNVAAASQFRLEGQTITRRGGSHSERVKDSLRGCEKYLPSTTKLLAGLVKFPAVWRREFASSHSGDRIKLHSSR